MAKFIYLGVDGAADPEKTDAFGITFPVGKPVEVESPRVIAKLAGHPHFKKAEAEPAEPRRGPGRPRNAD